MGENPKCTLEVPWHLSKKTINLFLEANKKAGKYMKDHNWGPLPDDVGAKIFKKFWHSSLKDAIENGVIKTH